MHRTTLNCAQARGWYPGPWIRWLVVRRNSFAGVSALAVHDANGTATPPRCGALVLRAERGFNSTDVVAENQTFLCPSGMTAGGNDVVGCDHCAIS